MDPAPAPSDLGPLTSAADECLVFDLEGRILAVNEATCRALDCTAAELLGRRAWEVCTCLTERGFEHTIEAIRAEGPQSLLGHLRQKNGTLVATDTQLWFAPLGGKPCVFALAREMRGCQGVVEERDQLANLIEESSDFVLLLDRDLRVTHANAAGLQRLGFARVEDAAGLALDELFDREQRERIERQVVPALLRDGWNGELLLRSWNEGHGPTPCWVHAYPVRHSRTRKLMGYALAARDITARVLIDRRRARLLRLAEISRSVATMLLAGDDLNEAVFQILAGVTELLAASRGYLDRFREDGRWVLRTHEWSPAGGRVQRKDGAADSEEHYRWATETLARGVALRSADGEPLPAPGGRGLLGAGERALLAVPVLIDGKLANVFGFVCDHQREWDEEEVASVQLIVDSFARGVERQIVAREKAQVLRELERSVERERVASRYKSEFLASMSHELRTPMNAIRGYAELLSRPHSERAQQETWVQNLRRSTEYMLGLVHDVLDLSKIEAGHMRVERQSASLAEVLYGVEDLMGASAHEKCLTYRLVIEGEVPEFLDTDPVRLKQILVNLTGNAIKFTSQGSVVVRLRQKGDEHTGRKLEVAVSDTGIGIPPEAIDRLFQPFSQVHRGSGGTGLGLQISRSLARLLGGDITVQSQVGRGSVFSLELPITGARGALRSLPPRGSAPAPGAKPLPAILRGKRILVVDDSPENREVLRFLLQEAGASCETAVNGQLGVERALAAARANAPFDVVLMDMNMPLVDGFEATRALVRAGLKTPVIALTALALAGDEQRCREAGCVDYVGKPIVPSAFFDTLARHLGRDGAAGVAPERAGAAVEPAAGKLLSLAQHPRFRGLVERYVASFPELVGKLRRLERLGKLEEVRTLVHRLRGTAASYGFPAVSVAAGRCEDAIRAGATQEEVARGLEELLDRLTLAAAG